MISSDTGTLPTCRGRLLMAPPLLLAIIAPVMLTTSYAIAVLRGDVTKLFPYISDTGGYAPESCIFGQLLNIICLLLFIGMILRYKQVESMVLALNVYRLNDIALVVGSLSALGGSLVANFQDTTVIMVHYVGAFLLFGCGIVYCFINTYISYKVNFHCNRKWLCHLRLFLSLMGTVSLVSCLVGSNYAQIGWMEGHVSKDIFHWGPRDGGYAAHLISTFSEWVMSLCLMGFFVTFVPDFLNMQLTLLLRFFQNV